MLSASSAEISRWLGEFIWPFLRILALFSVAPGFGSAAIPVRVKVAIAFVIALVIAPTIGSAAPLTLSWTALMLAVQQVLVGLVIGSAMQVMLAAMAFAGDFLGVQMGFGFANLFDVQNRFEVPVLSDFFSLVGLVLFLTLNGHLILLGVLVKSFAIVPVAPNSGIAAAGWHVLARAGALLFQMGVWLALPVLAVLLAVQLGLAIISRVAPQINVISVGFALFMWIGIAALITLVPFFAPAVAHMIAAGANLASAALRGG
ncbi:MAG: flagellar biosynthetic protein FliR [Stellaceae bacterium]